MGLISGFLSNFFKVSDSLQKWPVIFTSIGNFKTIQSYSIWELDMNLQAERNIPHSIIKACLLKMSDGFRFEDFAKAILNITQGLNFVPVGGIHDGGQDSFVYESSDKRIVYQFSIRKDWRTKIRKTIERIQANPQFNGITFSVIYVTNIEIEQSEIDTFQIKILTETGVNCLILENSKLTLEVDSLEETRKQFIDFCTRFAVFLEVENQVKDIYSSDGLDNTLVYLKHFSESSGQVDYLEILVSTHLFNCLKETDPDKKLFVSYSKCIEYICGQLPNLSKDFISENVQKIFKRIEKKHRDDREIRDHQNEGYCLAYSKRLQVQEFIAQDAILFERFTAELVEQIAICSNEVIKTIDPKVVEAIIKDVLAEVFRRQGLEISVAIHDPKSAYVNANLKEITQSVIATKYSTTLNAKKLHMPIFDIVYNILWRPTSIQKEFCTSLAKTFSLLFLGRADAHVVKHLKQSARGLRLLMGTDVIIKVLAEIHLPNELQRFTNLIRSLRASQVTLCVCDSILRETAAHIRSSINWYREHIQPSVKDAESDPALREVLDFEERFSGKILIRAHYHAKNDGKVKTFEEFIENFVGPNQNHFYKDIFDYLRAEFGVEQVNQKIAEEDRDFQFVFSELMKVNGRALTEHAKRIIIETDAKTIMCTYHLRKDYPIGQNLDFILPEKVWWLTFESKISKVYGKLEERFGNLPNINPVVIVSLLANLDVLTSKSTFDSVLGTAIGINMSHTVPDEIVEMLNTTYQSVKTMNKGKKAQLMRRIFENLQAGDFDKVTHYFEDYFSQVKKEQGRIEEIHANMKGNMDPKEIWKAVSLVESNPIKRVILFKEVTEESFPRTLAILKDVGLSDEVQAFLDNHGQNALSKIPDV